ncbi:hypothetical protein LV89_04924 [Arcicella aurantiaca]|uniref:Uncharacterized protein n=1 Tax=Arcicella aurantiaca TaxID=591202 RepID=A0A316DFU7_9BACT|nr:hypothetical protein [Arcicella aurantiaca]PWK16109.1 hypothetical protein LV89_04924 [Arcicella aurantiaca]
MKKIRLYRAYYEAPNNKNGYTLVTAHNKQEALMKATQIGLIDQPKVKFNSVEFQRWIYA